MIFQHPDRKTNPHKKIISRHHHITIHQLIRDGWIDITPPRSPKQIAHAKNFRNHGTLVRLKHNLHDVFRIEQGKLSEEQRRTLNKAEIVIQQLIKKYQAPAT